MLDFGFSIRYSIHSTLSVSTHGGHTGQLPLKEAILGGMQVKLGTGTSEIGVC